MVWEWRVINAIAKLLVRVPRALRAELPDRPVIAVRALQEGQHLVVRVAVGSLWVGFGRHRHRDYYWGFGGDVAEVEVGFGVLQPGTGYQEAKEGGHSRFEEVEKDQGREEVVMVAVSVVMDDDEVVAFDIIQLKMARCTGEDWV